MVTTHPMIYDGPSLERSSSIAARAVEEARRSLVWPAWLVAETPAERWLKAKCEKRVQRRERRAQHRRGRS